MNNNDQKEDLQTKQRQYLTNLIAKHPMSEIQLQSKCSELLYWFYPESRQRLVQIFNNSLRANTSGFGIVAGVADMFFLMPDGRIKFIEFKFGLRARQSDAQRSFQALCDTLGHKYFICDSEALFWLIIGFRQPCESDIDSILEKL